MAKFENPAYYKNFASLQKKVALELAKELPEECKRILDIGCGTGFLGEALAELGFKGQIYGVDASAAMLSLINPRIYAGTSVLKINKDTILPRGFTYASSMFLQWVGQPEKLITQGDFYFAMPLAGSLYEAEEAFKKAGLPSPILEFTAPQNTRPFRTITYVEEWKSLLAFLHHLNKIGAKNEGFQGALSHRLFYKLEPLFSRKITWEIGFFKI